MADSRVLNCNTMEATLKETMSAAQQVADDIIANARKESENMISEAGIEAANIVKSAEEKVSAINEELV